MAVVGRGGASGAGVTLEGEAGGGDVLEGHALGLEQDRAATRAGHGDVARQQVVELDRVGPVEASGGGRLDEVATLGAAAGHVVADDGGAAFDDVGADLAAVVLGGAD